MEATPRGPVPAILQTVLEQSSDAVFVADPSGRCDRANERWRELTGLDPTRLRGLEWTSAVHPDERPTVTDAWQAALAAGAPYERLTRIRRPEGAEHHVRVTVTPVAGPDGVVAAWVGTLRTDDPRVTAEANNRFEQAFRRSPIGMAITTLEGRYLRVNPAMCTLLGRSPSDLVATSVMDTTHPDDVARTIDAVLGLLGGRTASFSLEKRFLDASGESVWTRATTTLLRDDADQPVQFLTQVEDITERRALIEQLRLSALRDPLTGLANRAGLEEFLASLPGDATIGVVAMDLDRFKDVNDTAGHAAGDTVLQVVARRILSAIRPEDHAARTGGDEFVVICSHPGVADGLGVLADRLARRLGEPVRTGAGDMSVGCSVGVAHGARADASTLMIQADEACYAAKRARRVRPLGIA